MPPVISPQIDFAKRHLTPKASTFNAASAIYRLDALLEDINTSSERLKSVEDSMYYPWGFEFTSYYLVGFVTCLEWHARSRLYDLFVYDPKSIESSEIKQSISDAKLQQMLSENLTIAHLIAGSINISTCERYLQVFSRILKHLGSDSSIGTLLDDIEHEGFNSAASVLESVFVNRNTLVHEISITTIGHPNIRDWMHFEDIIALGNIVKQCMKSIEKKIYEIAPKRFPNLIDEEGYPVDEIEYLQFEIVEAEQRIGQAIEDGKFPEGVTASQWTEVASTSTKHLLDEVEFLDRLEIAGAKYFDIRPYIISSMLKQRLYLLTLYEKELFYDDPL